MLWTGSRLAEPSAQADERVNVRTLHRGENRRFCSCTATRDRETPRTRRCAWTLTRRPWSMTARQAAGEPSVAHATLPTGRSEAIAMAQEPRTRLKPNHALLGVVLIAASAFAGLVGLLVADAVEPAMLWPEVAKALITVLAVAFIGGTIKLLLDQHVHDREQREQENVFLRDCIAEAEDIRRGIEHARMLVMAHKSAKSYHDRMHEIIALRVRADSLARRIATRWPPGEHADEVALVERRAEQVVTYLGKLTCEYQHKYKPVADQQRVDEAGVDAAIRQYTDSKYSQGCRGLAPPTLPWHAWDMLCSPDFPVLNDFLTGGPASEYERTVSPSCRATVAALNNILWGASASPRTISASTAGAPLGKQEPVSAASSAGSHRGAPDLTTTSHS